MTLRVVIGYEQDGPGWSEVYWHNGSSIDSYLSVDAGNFLTPGSPASVLVNARLAMMVQTAHFTHIRVTKVEDGTERAAGRGPDIYNAGQLYQPGGVVPWPGASNFEKLLCRCEAGTVTRKSIWLGGIPNFIISPDQSYVALPPWPDKLIAFSNLMTGGAYGVYGRNTRASAQPITSFTANNATGRAAVLQPIPSNWPADGLPHYVVLRGISNPPGWNGVHRAWIDPGTPTFLQIGPTRRPMRGLPVWTLGAGGTVQYLVPRFTAFDRFRAERVSKRNLGRPFAQPVGRRNR